MRNTQARQRDGFALVEALVALIIVCVAFLGFEGSLALIVRTMSDSQRETVATRIAETQRERAFAGGCATTSGRDSVNAIMVTWTASPVGHLTYVTQVSRYPQRLGDRVENSNAVGVCQ